MKDWINAEEGFRLRDNSTGRTYLFDTAWDIEQAFYLAGLYLREGDVMAENIANRAMKRGRYTTPDGKFTVWLKRDDEPDNSMVTKVFI